MLKALLKKQLLENYAFLFQGKNGKKRSAGAMAGFALLLLYGLGAMVYMFYAIGKMLCVPFAAQGLDWAYFAFMGLLATGFGVIGGMFTAKAKLYEAKDNDLLFSMPIPAWLVLFSRMIGLYLYVLLFEALVFIPAVVCYFVEVGFALPVLFGSLLSFLFLPLGSLAVCALLGWLLALAAAKLPWKNLLTTLLSVGFMVGYFFLYSKLNEYMTYMIANGGKVAAKMKTALYPFAKLGLACAGDILAWALYALIFGGVFALAYTVISLTYLRLVTANRGGKKTKYKSKTGKRSSPYLALLKREGIRYIKNPMVALNCFLGTIFFVVLPFLPLFAGEIKTLVKMLSGEQAALVLAVALTTVASMNMLSASSVSLEGDSLWILRSLPLSTEKILSVKAGFHFFVTAIPAWISGVVLGCIFHIPAGYLLLALVAATAFILLMAVSGLVFNLKMPNMHWTNELAVVKQSMSTMVGLFTSWGVVIALVGGYFLFGNALFAGGYFLVCIAALCVASGLLIWWLTTRGKGIFEEL